MSLEDQIDRLSDKLDTLENNLTQRVDILEKLLFLGSTPATIAALNDDDVTKRYITLKSGRHGEFRAEQAFGDRSSYLKISGTPAWTKYRDPQRFNPVPEEVKKVVQTLVDAGMNIRVE